MADKILDQILNTFPAASLSQWEQSVAKELKGASLESLTWKIADNLSVKPYFTEENQVGIDTTALQNYNPDWQIGQKYYVENYKTSNEQVLADLMHGLNAPVFEFAQEPSIKDLKVLFENVGLAYIHTHFENTSNSFTIAWEQFLTEKALTNIDYSIKSDVEGAYFVDARKFYQNTEDCRTELQECWKETLRLFESANDKNAFFEKFHIAFYVDNFYFRNIAKLRAFKLLFSGLSSTKTLPFVSVEIAPNAYKADAHDNLIRASSMAMSAVFGGCNHLVLRPTGTDLEALRLARNIQLILKHESGLHEVADPANGSYYIENLTNLLLQSIELNLNCIFEEKK
jgi:methylmalonyl-CoA mutase